jgi:hypothetical protein
MKQAQITAILLVAAFVGCNKPEINEINSDCVNAGNHYFRLNDRTFGKNDDRMVAYRHFTKGSDRYDTGYDQLDWLKVRGGVDFHCLDNNRNGYQIVKRYIPNLDVWEFGPYIHHSGSTYRPDYPHDNPYHLEMSQAIVRVPTGQWVEVHRNILPDTKSVAVTFITEDGETGYYEHEFTHWPNRDRWEETNSYFGGTSPAPDTYCWTWQLIGRE